MAIVITAKRDGFRRCGIAHPSKTTYYPDDFFTEEQLKALDKEPQLILAYAKDEFVQVQERFNESLSQAASPQAPNTLETLQPKAPEANAAPVGDAVVSAVSQVLGNSEPGSDVPGSGPIPMTGKVEGSSLNDNQDILASVEQPDVSPASADAANTASKPEKARSTKGKGDVK